MDKEQLIQIAKVGFPKRVKQFINFENCEIHSRGGIYRLYDKDEVFMFGFPQKYHLAVIVNTEEKFIQFVCEFLAFNHYAAIKEMERMGLI